MEKEKRAKTIYQIMKKDGEKLEYYLLDNKGNVLCIGSIGSVTRELQDLEFNK